MLPVEARTLTFEAQTIASNFNEIASVSIISFRNGMGQFQHKLLI